jgi:Alpha/beta hydrolase
VGKRILALLVGAALTMGGTTIPAPAAPLTDILSASKSATDLASISIAANAASSSAAEPRIRAAVAKLTAGGSFVPAPTAVKTWWSALDGRTQARITSADPTTIGNLEGLPYATRDAANRSVLASTIADLTRESRTSGRGEGIVIQQRLTALGKVASALAVASDGEPHQLITLDPTGTVRAAVAIGDLQTASYVNFLVPGMYYSVANQIVGWTKTAVRVQEEQSAWLRYFKKSGHSAVVAWIGYQTPDVLNVTGVGLAEKGAAQLTQAVRGLKAERSGSEPFLAMLSHSYGATLTLMALQEHAFTVDALALVGAPGSSAQSVKTLSVPSNEVYVGQDAFDIIAPSGFFGSYPNAPSYGATEMGTAAGIDPMTHTKLVAAIGHDNYFQAGTQSLRNMSLVGIGEGAYVTAPSTSANGELALAR